MKTVAQQLCLELSEGYERCLNAGRLRDAQLMRRAAEEIDRQEAVIEEWKEPYG